MEKSLPFRLEMKGFQRLFVVLVCHVLVALILPARWPRVTRVLTVLVLRTCDLTRAFATPFSLINQVSHGRHKGRLVFLPRAWFFFNASPGNPQRFLMPGSLFEMSEFGTTQLNTNTYKRRGKDDGRKSI